MDREIDIKPVEPDSVEVQNPYVERPEDHQTDIGSSRGRVVVVGLRGRVLGPDWDGDRDNLRKLPKGNLPSTLKSWSGPTQR